MNIAIPRFHRNVVKKLPIVTVRTLLSLVVLASASFAATHPLLLKEFEPATE